jgi:hypothetical protein
MKHRSVISPITLLPIVILHIFISSSSAFSQTGQVKGRVFNSKNNEPLPFVNLIIDGKPSQGATSDADGNFTLANVDPGYIRVVATYVGFKRFVSEDFLVTRSHTVVISIPMAEEAVTLQDVTIKASATLRKQDSPVSMQTLSVQEIEKTPGANRDISKVIQALPGVGSSVSFRNDIIVRGGGPNENRFYLDGMEIPNINHFATQGASGGPVGIINTDFIREVRLYTGAFPAKHGNMLSSDLELFMIDGSREKFGGRVSLGSSDLGLTLNGPVTKNSSLIFSYRRSYLQFLFGALGLPFLPTYNDYQLKYKVDFDKHNQLSVISIGALDDSKLNTGIKNPNETQRYILGYLPEYHQWNYAIGLVYRHFREKGYGTWVLSRNMLDNEQVKYRGNISTPDSLNLDYKSQESENKLRYENLTELSGWKITYGAGLEYARYYNQTYQKIFSVGEVRTLDYTSLLHLWKWSVFGQVNKAFFKNRLDLSLGIRMDASNYSAEMNNLLRQFSPRFSLSYGIIPSKWFLNFSIGRYFQLPAYTIMGFRNNLGALVNDSLGLKYISADHLVLGFDVYPVKNMKISVEGFYKYYQDYPYSIRDSISIANKGSDFSVVGNEPVLPTSKGRAYGVEFLFRIPDLHGFNILVSYTWFRSEFTDFAGTYIPSAWDARNLLNVVAGYKFKHNWQVGARYRLSGGLPYTPYDVEKSSLVAAWDAQGQGYFDNTAYNTLRLTNFHQLDVRVDKSFFFKKWSLMLYVDVQNVLNYKAQQQDILVNTQPDGSTVTYTGTDGQPHYELRTIPNTAGTIVPAIGIMVDF